MDGISEFSLFKTKAYSSKGKNTDQLEHPLPVIVLYSEDENSFSRFLTLLSKDITKLYVTL